MYLMDDGIRLEADLVLPGHAGEKYPLVVLIHGFTGNRNEPHLNAVTEALTAGGFAVLKADMYGHGESGGEFRTHTLYKWLGNAMTLVDYARSLPEVDGIWLCGHSQGGLTAMLAAAMERDVIRGVIPLSPAVIIPEHARTGWLLSTQFDAEHLPEYVLTDTGRRLDANYIRVAQTIKVEDAIARYNGPVLVVHGDRDETVPFEAGKAAAEAYAHASFRSIAGGSHCFAGQEKEMADVVVRWLKDQV